MEKIKSLKGEDTWDILNLPREKKFVGCKWDFIVKDRFDWDIEMYMAKLVTWGFTQVFRIDYEETFALVAKLNPIKVLLSSTNLDWKLYQMDIENAFLNGELNEEIYMNFHQVLRINYKKIKSANWIVIV